MEYSGPGERPGSVKWPWASVVADGDPPPMRNLPHEIESVMVASGIGLPSVSTTVPLICVVAWEN
jgi:hypothetical protein